MQIHIRILFLVVKATIKLLIIFLIKNQHHLSFYNLTDGNKTIEYYFRFFYVYFQPKKKEKEHATKKPIKTDRQKKAEAEMMKKLIIQYVS